MARVTVLLTPVCLLLLAILPAARAADEVELRWRFTKGQTLKYLLKHREVRTVAVGDQKRVTTNNAEYEWQWTVKDVDDQGTATIQQKLTALRVTANGTDWDFAYDSSRGNSSDDEYKKKLIHFYDQLRFADYRLKLRSDGTVAEVYGFDKLQDELRNGLEFQGFNVLDFEGLNLRDGSFGWLLQQALGALPRGAVAKGARWSQPAQARLAGLGALTGQTDFTLGEPVKVGDRPCREVRLKGAQALEVDLKWVGNNNLRGTLKSSKLEGAVRFDPKAGKVAAGEVQVEMAGELKLGANDRPAVLKVSFEHALELEEKP